MSQGSDFKYDVGLSFLSEDEVTARRLADKLQEKGWSVFFYPERQQDLAGPEGIENFRQAFREDARLSVVLFREDWGTTRWTGVEAEAIKGRQMDDRWRSFLIVRVGPGELPSWVPDTHVWFDLQRFGLDEAVAFIDTRLRRELGGKAEPETPVERAERLNREREQEYQKQQFLHSENGVGLANSELSKLAKHLEEQATKLTESGTEVRFSRKRANEHAYCLSSSGASFTLGWQRQWANSLEHSYLYLAEYKGRYSFQGIPRRDDPESERMFYFDLDGRGNPVWTPKKGERHYSTTEFANLCLERLVERHFASMKDCRPNLRSFT